MTDRELLKLAAKAAGIQLFELDEYEDVLADGTPWNPLADDGEALRMAVRLELDIHQQRSDPEVLVQAPMMRTVIQPIDDDRMAATRRAICRAAAAIGKAMP